MKRLLNFLCVVLACPVVQGALPHQVYVWQRAWTQPVSAAVAAHSTNFSETAVLTAEVVWQGKTSKVFSARPDYAALARIGCPVGLVLRVGPFKGELATNAPAVEFLARLAASSVAEARTNQIDPVELQIDFDCAASKLDDYRAWVGMIQRWVAPLPVTITALPNWLDSPAFAKLAATATNYILQVHSLEKPTDIKAPFTLCDPVAARLAVKRAGEIGVPFRVALPTYGYTIAFGADGKFIGLAAEQNKTWSAGSQLRELRADPSAMSSLVNFWNTNAPSALRGVIWYRLPVAVDNLNWRWPTLGAIVAGRELREEIHAVARRVEPGLIEVSLINDGTLDISSRLAVEVRWSNARLVAGDGLRGFELAEENASAAKIQNQQSSLRLPAGEKITIGWLRFDQENGVQLEVKKF